MPAYCWYCEYCTVLVQHGSSTSVLLVQAGGLAIVDQAELLSAVDAYKLLISVLQAW